jgi:hypothetical protein
MNSLLYLDNIKLMSDSTGTVVFTQAPDVGFSYCGIRYTPAQQEYQTVIDGPWLPLDSEKIESIENAIINIRNSAGPNVHAVDSNGFYIGFTTRLDPNFSQEVPDHPPDSAEGWKWNNALNPPGWNKVYFFDAAGNQVLSRDLSVGSTAEEPPSFVFVWNTATQAWSISEYAINHARELCLYDLNRANMLGVVRYLYNEHCCEDSYTGVNDYLSSITNAIVNVSKDWLQANISDQFAINQYDVIVQTQQQLISQNNTSTDVNIFMGNLKSFLDLTTLMTSAGCASGVLIDYPPPCNGHTTSTVFQVEPRYPVDNSLSNEDVDALIRTIVSQATPPTTGPA